jgi:sulfite reductase (ferredoxin)
MSASWKEALSERLPEELAREIDIFETELELRRKGKLDEKLFNETRLRRGVYGQRYDNGQRHDGVRTQKLEYPSGDVMKGPGTLWDAPGMQRIKIPFGSVTPDQLDTLAELAEDYSDGILHITTRQDFQLHFVSIDDTPDLMRRLGAVGITTREACGNSVRNVTACPLAGVCHTESFDVTPYATAISYFLLGHPDAQDFGRKFKIAFSGCKQEACGLITFHDLGFIAQTRAENGETRRGFEFYVGGGLGAVPHQATLFEAFLPEEEMLPMAQAVCRVFARLGEKKNRARARLKFLVSSLGIDEFRRLVLEERAKLPAEPRWTDLVSALKEGKPAPGGFLVAASDKPARPAARLSGNSHPDAFHRWMATNVYRQRQPGYAVAAITVPLGDLSSHQTRELAELARRFSGDSVRTTVDQNIVLRWVPEADLPALYTALAAIGLGEPGASTIVDVTACPGTDTCKLGIASSRGLAEELRTRLLEKNLAFDAAVKNLHIKVSGCFNSCGQHHVADLGFYGVSRKSAGRTVPHFQVVLGGQWTENAKSYGLAMGAVPSKRIPDVVSRMTDSYRGEAQPGESFQDFIKRMGKVKIRSLLDDLTTIPIYEADRTLFSDWGDPREFTIGDMGQGECAGEVVSRFDFGLAASERQVFEAQVQLDGGNPKSAMETALRAMVGAAEALIRSQDARIDFGSEDTDRIVREFKDRFYETKLFFDPYAGGKFAHYFFRAHEEAAKGNAGHLASADAAHHRIEEAQLFVEAVYACHGRILERQNVTA